MAANLTERASPHSRNQSIHSAGTAPTSNVSIMSTPASLCDPFAALLLDHKPVYSTTQASLGETMGPDPTTTDILPPSTRSHNNLLIASPSPVEPANAHTHLELRNLPAHCRNRRDSTLSNRAPTPNNTEMSEEAVPSVMEPNRSQSIIEALHNFIQEERLRNFYFLGLSSHHYMAQEELLVVSAANDEAIQEALTGHHDLTAYIDCDWFTFRQMASYDSSIHTVMITIPSGAAMSVEAMTIIEPYSKGSITSAPALTWMLDKYNLEDEGAMKFSGEQYEEQFLWWSNNKKAFRVLDLPAELRDAIYLQIIGPVILPDLRGPQTVFGRGLSYGRTVDSQMSRDPEIEAPNMSIMRVNRQVWIEVSRVATRDSQKCFRMVGPYNFATARRGPSSSPTQIATRWLSSAPQTGFFRKLQLEMSAAAYFESIGIKPTQTNPLASATSNFPLSSLRHFTALRELDFRFIGPKHPDAICPWALISNTHKTGEHSCQKLWIHWFFVLGWDNLEQLRQKDKVRFTLSGCVKASSKQYWEHVLNTKGNSHLSIIKANETSIRQQKTDNSPIACACSTSCAKAEAGKEYTWTDYEVDKIGGLQEHIDDIYWSFKD